MEKYTLLKKHFGYEQFRVGQEEIIDQAMKGRDVLAIMPTGGGKSLCYQLPALMYPGVTVVISPLIALMKDQVDALNENGIRATFLNSSLSASENNERIRGIKNDEYRLIYVAPERLLTECFYQLTQYIDISMVAVDESHCISQWGHDFRPSYKNIPQFIARLAKRPVVTAFTATATTYVVAEIRSLLGLIEPFVKTTGFDRENLFYKIVKPTDKFRFVKSYLKEEFDSGVGIIYCSTRKTVESLSEKLKQQGFSVGAYHGGMDSETRNAIQDDFMLDNLKVIVATNAFGMGIDKSDVRFVIHYNMPKNMEAYYQEAGRAGRDGLDSTCILMYSPSDIVKQKLMIAQNSFDANRDEIQRKNLQILVNYCHTNDCLRREIVNYFGEERPEENCGSCGNCLNDAEFVDMSIESQKILSCIYRTDQRFGVSMIIKVLRGSKDKKILDWKLNEVSTYGIITDYSEGGLRELIMNLIARGFIHMTVDQYPVLKLTQTSRSVLVGDEKIMVRKERINVKDSKKKKQKRKTNFDYDETLFDLLTEKRKELATDKKVPLYVIFANSVLEELAYVMPTNKEGFLDVKGIGEKKFDSYGKTFMDIIETYINEKNIEVNSEQRIDEIYESVEVSSKDRYEQTLDLYKEGISLDELAQKRGLTSATIIKHLAKLKSKGHDVDLHHYLDRDKHEEIKQLIEEHGSESLKVIKDHASEEISYTDIQLSISIMAN